MRRTKLSSENDQRQRIAAKISTEKKKNISDCNDLELSKENGYVLVNLTTTKRRILVEFKVCIGKSLL